MFQLKEVDIFAIVILMLILSPWLATIAEAHYCSEPSRPICLDLGFNYSGDFDMCRFEVESFVRSTNAYVQCLADAQNEAIRKSNRVVDQFNCKARRETFCY